MNILHPNPDYTHTDTYTHSINAFISIYIQYVLFLLYRLFPENIFYIDTNGRLLHQKSQECIRIETSTWLLKLGPCLTDNKDEK